MRLGITRCCDLRPARLAKNDAIRERSAVARLLKITPFECQAPGNSVTTDVSARSRAKLIPHRGLQSRRYPCVSGG